jgi:hypothetical protein
MTTKKIVVIVVAVVVTLALLVAIVVGAIVGFVVYSIGNSEAAVVAKDFLRSNERLKQEIGEVKDFGTFVSGNISINNGNGAANLNIKVIGEKKTVNASVQLMQSRGGDWRVIEASYKNDAGQTVDLLSAYDARFFPFYHHKTLPLLV